MQRAAYVFSSVLSPVKWVWGSKHSEDEVGASSSDVMLSVDSVLLHHYFLAIDNVDTWCGGFAHTASSEVVVLIVLLGFSGG